MIELEYVNVENPKMSIIYGKTKLSENKLYIYLEYNLFRSNSEKNIFFRINLNNFEYEKNEIILQNFDKENDEIYCMT